MQEARAAFPGIIHSFGDLEPNLQIPDGESRAEFQERVCRTFDRLAEECRPGWRVLVVAHGGTMRMAMGRFYGQPCAEAMASQVDNASMTVAHYFPEARRWRLVRWNCPLAILD